MRFIIILYVIVFSFCLKAQNGFIQAYDFDERGMAFHNMLLVEDTLMVFGTVRNPDLPQWGVYFSKMDTTGNILDYRVHYDSLGDSYVFEPGYEMIKTNDGGYAIVGQMFVRNHPILIKLDVNGDLEFVKEYPDTTVLNMRHWNIIELESGGYISTGIKQQMNDGLSNAFIMRTDKQGNKIWEISYGETGLGEGFRGLRQINENEIILSGGYGIQTPTVNPNPEAWNKALVIKIDTLGNVLEEWESEPAFAGQGSSVSFGRTYPASDGNWINKGFFKTIEEILGEPTLLAKGEIVKRDTNFNVIWRTSFGQPTNTTNGFTDIAQTPDEGWVAVGRYTTEDDVEEDGYRAVMIAKVNADGDSLWSRTDTLFSPLTIASHPYLSGVVVLPSGSIIACGKVDKIWPEPGKSWAWLIKADKNGCMEPGCSPFTNGVNLIPLLEGVSVFPNPTSDKVHVAVEDYFDIEIYDLKGQILHTQSHIFEEIDLSLNSFSSGIYFLKVKKGNRMITKKIVKY